MTYDSDDDLVRDLYPRLIRYAAVVGAAWQDPDDLVHDALVATLGAHRLIELDQPMSYLRRAVLTAAMKRQRRLGLFRRSAPLLVSAEPEHPHYRSDLDDLEHLDPRDRSLLYLIYVEGRSFAEVGGDLGVSEAACRQRASRARIRLQREIRVEEARHAR